VKKVDAAAPPEAVKNNGESDEESGVEEEKKKKRKRPGFRDRRVKIECFNPGFSQHETSDLSFSINGLIC
jgi:hypothetical protein